FPGLSAVGCPTSPRPPAATLPVLVFFAGDRSLSPFVPLPHPPAAWPPAPVRHAGFHLANRPVRPRITWLSQTVACSVRAAVSCHGWELSVYGRAVFCQGSAGPEVGPGRDFRGRGHPRGDQGGASGRRLLCRRLPGLAGLA